VGDLSACHELYDEFAKRVFNYIYRMVDDLEDADDLAQNVFVRAFRELKNLRNEERFEPWLYRIARNEIYQRFRKMRVVPERQVAANGERKGAQAKLDQADGMPTPQERLNHAELGMKIRNVLISLPSEHREVFVLAVMQEKSYAEVAEIVGRSLQSVKTDLFRARLHVLKTLGQSLEIEK
jgi:RNA polymerase sigma-70 factor (ECF subfamily)